MTADRTPYPAHLIRRFEPGTVQSLTNDTLRAAKLTLEFSRGLRSVRVIDARGQATRMTWAEFEDFIDDLRVRAGKQAIFTTRSRRRR